MRAYVNKEPRSEKQQVLNVELRGDAYSALNKLCLRYRISDKELLERLLLAQDRKVLDLLKDDPLEKQLYLEIKEPSDAS